MVQTKLGRYWEQAKRWFVCKVWPFKAEEGRERKYPKCVPLAKARSMSEGQRRSAVARKRAAANVGPKPTNVKTIAKRKNARSGGLMSPTSDKPNSSMNNMMRQAQRDYKGSYISGNLGGVNVSNPSSKNIMERR